MNNPPGSGRDEDPASRGTPGGIPQDGSHPGVHAAGGPGGGERAGRRDARRARKLARGFAEGGPLDQALPGPGLTRALDQACGPARRCEGAGDDEVSGMLGRWEASEAWCAAGKLGVIRALICRRARPGYEPAAPGALPGSWQEGLTQEVSNELGVSARAADALIGLAADLEERLKLTAAALAAGVISLAKARIIHEATAVLDDAHAAAAAETLIASQLAGKTPGQIANPIAHAVVKVDPEGARKRREKAQREDARVRFWREHAGTAALAAFGLPPDEALAANQNVQDKALEYKAAGVPGSMDQLRVRAFLDAINGTSSLPAPSPGGTGETGTGETGTGETGTGEAGTGETGTGETGTSETGTSDTDGPAQDGTTPHPGTTRTRDGPAVTFTPPVITGQPPAADTAPGT